MVVFSSSVALLLAGTVFGFFGMKWFKKQTERELTTLADYLAYASVGPLDFGSKESAQQVIDSLQANKDIVAGCLYDMNDVLFVEYQRPGSKQPLPATPSPLGFNPRKLECVALVRGSS